MDWKWLNTWIKFLKDYDFLGIRVVGSCSTSWKFKYARFANCWRTNAFYGLHTMSVRGCVTLMRKRTEWRQAPYPFVGLVISVGQLRIGQVRNFMMTWRRFEEIFPKRDVNDIRDGSVQDVDDAAHASELRLALGIGETFEKKDVTTTGAQWDQYKDVSTEAETTCASYDECEAVKSNWSTYVVSMCLSAYPKVRKKKGRSKSWFRSIR